MTPSLHCAVLNAQPQRRFKQPQNLDIKDTPGLMYSPSTISSTSQSSIPISIVPVTAQPGRSLYEDPKYMRDDPRWDQEVRGATAVLERLLESWEKAPRAEDHVRVGRAVSTRDPYPPSRDYQEAWD
ncbi:hypothetical protein EDB89DRAFT_2081958 [Lactarius sanguifluus]|nr:hypothetical protein EDB89DRAFT_2081958 [Lactarius sanguifluus]